MFNTFLVAVATSGLAISVCDAQSSTLELRQETLKPAIRRSLTLLEKSSAESANQRKCFTCHGQTLPVLALTEAQKRGFVIDGENVQRQLKHTHEHLKRGMKNYLQGKGQGGQVDTAGYAIWALNVGQWKADQVTASVSEYLLKYQNDQDHWTSSSNRPPSEASDFAATYVALIGLGTYGTTEQESQILKKTDAVKQWLVSSETLETEDRVFRLLALKYLDSDKRIVRSAAAELIDDQKDDGGWSQLADMTSDAYATGTVLYALRQSGCLSADDPSYLRGVRFLLDTQKADGSWHVASRSKPFQEYFESGFPHEKDQFISISASSWATIALLFTVPETTLKDP